MKNLLIITVLSFVFTACENNAVIEGHDHDHGHGHDHGSHNESQIELNPDQLQIANIQYGGFTKMDLSNNVKCNGKLELPPQNKASVSAIISGIVKDVKVIEGNTVKKGQTLAVIEHPDIINFQEDYLDIYNNLSVLENNYKRKEQLLKDSITSTMEFEKAQSDYESAVAKLGALKAKLNLLGISEKQVIQGNITSSITINSPIEGYVRLVEINIGKYIEPQDEMFEIVDNEHIHIDLQVYEQDINKIDIGQTVLFSLASNPDSVFKAKVFAIGKAFEENTKAVRVHAEITEHTNNLLPGMFVNASVQTNLSEAMVLPEAAVISDAVDEYIFVQSPEKHGDHMLFDKIKVVTGNKNMGFTQVMEPDSLFNKKNIVVKGAFYLDAEMKKAQGGHVH